MLSKASIVSRTCGILRSSGTLGGLDVLIFVAVAVPPERFISTPGVMFPPQELGDFEFDGLLEHELGTELNGLGERSLASGEAEELLFEDLIRLSWRFMDVVCFLVCRAKSAPGRFLQEA